MWPCKWFTGISGRRRANASALAVARPTRSAPISPGPSVTAIDLYQRLGFVETGVRRGYYTDNREDALIMWRDPSSPA